MDSTVVPIRQNSEQTRDYLRRFVDALFRYADEDTWVALRVFRDDGSRDEAILARSYRFDDPDLHAQIESAVVFAAEFATPAVFCPPISTFSKSGTAKNADLANGLALSVECDSDPEASYKSLRGILGEPTIVVESGGVWADPDDEWPQYKVHLHWRLTEPTRSPQDHAKLHLARSIACDIVGADSTSKNPVHPMRWPGSWHRKKLPRMATITASNEAAELELSDALERLSEAHKHVFKDRPVPTMDRKPLGGAIIQGLGLANPLQAQHLSDVASALEIISNRDLEWADWNRIMMAIWSATDGSQEGLEVAQEWSAKSAKHDQAATAARWAHYSTSPPTKIGAGTLFHLAHIEEPEWTKPSSAQHAALANDADRPRIRATPFIWIPPEKIPPRRWLYGKHYIRQFLSATIAPGGVGKSSLIIGEALAVVSGRPILQERVWESGNVWMWNGEDPIEELQRRIAAAVLHHGINPNELDGRLFIDSGRDMEIVIARETRDGVVIAEPVVDEVIATIRENNICTFMVDPFVSSHRVTENDNNAIDAVAKQWSYIANVTNCAIDLTHHARKTGGNEVTAEHGRGAIALIAAARCVRVLNQMSEAEGSEAGVQNRKAYFRVDDGKVNLTPASDRSQWMRMTSVALGNGGVCGGDEIGAVTAWEWPEAWEGISSAKANELLDEIDRGTGDDERYSLRAQDKDRWAGNIIIDACGKTEAQAKAVLKKWEENGILEVREYTSPSQRKLRKGIFVLKRPGVSHD